MKGLLADSLAIKTCKRFRFASQLPNHLSLTGKSSLETYTIHCQCDMQSDWQKGAPLHQLYNYCVVVNNERSERVQDEQY